MSLLNPQRDNQLHTTASSHEYRNRKNKICPKKVVAVQIKWIDITRLHRVKMFGHCRALDVHRKIRHALILPANIKNVGIFE